MSSDHSRMASSPSKEKSEYSELCKKILTALFYGVSSFMIMVVNKRVLTNYHFPSFQVLGIGQMVATVLILNVGKMLRIISFPELSTDTFRKIWPLPLMYLGNMVFGLGGTQNLSLPMMTVLRRFSILMTMIGRWSQLWRLTIINDCFQVSSTFSRFIPPEQFSCQCSWWSWELWWLLTMISHSISEGKWRFKKKELGVCELRKLKFSIKNKINNK